MRSQKNGSSEYAIAPIARFRGHLRRRLREELGVAPSAETQALHRALLG